MTSIFEMDENNDMWRMLPGGVYILFQHNYTAPELGGIFAVSITSIISVIAIVSLLIAIAVSLVRNWGIPDQDRRKDKRLQFIKSHAGIYFVCMLLSTLTFTLGFSLSLYWAIERRVTFGTFCTIQAALKQFGNVATALWVLAIAIHTFVVVFLQLRVAKWVGWTGFATVWILSAAVVIAGPLIYTTEEKGPWYGISAQWCWTSDTYVLPRFITEYLWMFLSAGASFILYVLLFLKLRGHISSDLRFSFRARPLGADMSRVAHQMLWYPVVYTVLVFPIAGCRIYEIRTFVMSPLEVKMGSAVFFMLFGLINVILYTLTRNILPLPPSLRRFLGLSPCTDEHSSPRNSEKSGFRRMSTRQDDEKEMIPKLSKQFSSRSPSSPSMPMFSRSAQTSFGVMGPPKRQRSNVSNATVDDVPNVTSAIEVEEGNRLHRSNTIDSFSSAHSVGSNRSPFSEQVTELAVPGRSYRPVSPNGSAKSSRVPLSVSPSRPAVGLPESPRSGLSKSPSVLSLNVGGLRKTPSVSSTMSSSSSSTESRGSRNGRAVLQKPNPALISPVDGRASI